MNMTEDGMLARFLIVISRPGNAGQERAVDREALERYRSLVGRIVAMLPGAQPCHLSPEAQGVRTELLAWIYRLAGSGALPDGIAAAVGKYEGSFARLCLVMHAAECADAGLPVIATEVSVNTAERVRALILDLLYPHAMRFYRGISEGGEGHMRAPALVAGYILATRCERLTQTQLWRYVSVWRQLEPRERREALNALQEAGWLGGRSDNAYTVNPEAHALFPEQAQIEADRRARYAAILDEKLGRVREPGEDA